MFLKMVIVVMQSERTVKKDDGSNCIRRINHRCGDRMEHTTHIRLPHGFKKYCISVITDCRRIEQEGR